MTTAPELAKQFLATCESTDHDVRAKDFLVLCSEQDDYIGILHEMAKHYLSYRASLIRNSKVTKTDAHANTGAKKPGSYNPLANPTSSDSWEKVKSHWYCVGYGKNKRFGDLTEDDLDFLIADRTDRAQKHLSKADQFTRYKGYLADDDVHRMAELSSEKVALVLADF